MFNLNMFRSLRNTTVYLLLSSSVMMVNLIQNNKLCQSNYIYCQPLLKNAKSAEMRHVLNTSSFFDVVGEAFFRVYITYISYSFMGLSAPHGLLIVLFCTTAM